MSQRHDSVRSRRFAATSAGRVSVAGIAAALLWLPGCASLPPDSEDHFRRGLASRQKAYDDDDSGALREAIEHFKEAIRTAGRSFHTQALLERGDCFLELAAETTDSERIDNLAAALADYQAVSTWHEPSVLDKARALTGEGRVYLERESPDQAEVSFQQVLDLREAEDSAAATLRSYHLIARRELGWIQLGPFLAEHRARGKASEESEPLREAQDQFFLGLEIDAGDRRSNLGLGICLHHRGQSGKAIRHLEAALSAAPESEDPDPQPHYFLARALEAASGYQKRAIRHYGLALDNDRDGEFLPLYQALAENLPVYFGVNDRPPEFYLSRLLEYAGLEDRYWESVTTLCERILQDEPDGSSDDRDAV